MTLFRTTPLILVVTLIVLPRLAGLDPDNFDLIWLLLYMIPLALLTYGCRGRPLLFGGAIAAILMAGAHDERSDEVAVARSFFGVNKVIVRGEGDDKIVIFKHGTTKHGVQYADPARRKAPLAYYHQDGPVGEVFRAYGSRLRELGGVGLGVGAVACYQQPGRRWTFYEIDPLVVSLARDQGYFHYLTECAPNARMVIGDGRLSLANDADPKFDLLMLDAFSSDAIPLHLVTREAMAVYLSRLAPEGLLLFHISNRHVDLRPVIADLAGDAGIHAYIRYDPGGDKDSETRYGSTWIAMAREQSHLAPVLAIDGWEALPGRPGRRVWTDDYGNLITITHAWRDFWDNQSDD